MPLQSKSGCVSPCSACVKVVEAFKESSVKQGDSVLQHPPFLSCFALASHSSGVRPHFVRCYARFLLGFFTHPTAQWLPSPFQFFGALSGDIGVHMYRRRWDNTEEREPCRIKYLVEHQKAEKYPAPLISFQIKDKVFEEFVFNLDML